MHLPREKNKWLFILPICCTLITVLKRTSTLLMWWTSEYNSIIMSHTYITNPDIDSHNYSIKYVTIHKKKCHFLSQAEKKPIAVCLLIPHSISQAIDLSRHITSAGLPLSWVAVQEVIHRQWSVYPRSHKKGIMDSMFVTTTDNINAMKGLH